MIGVQGRSIITPTDNLSHCDVKSKRTLWEVAFLPLGLSHADPPDLREEDQPCDAECHSCIDQVSSESPESEADDGQKDGEAR